MDTATTLGVQAIVSTHPGTDVEQMLNRGLSDLNTSVQLLTQEMKQIAKNFDIQVSSQTAICGEVAVLKTQMALVQAAQTTLKDETSKEFRTQKDEENRRFEAQKADTARRMQAYSIFIAALAIIVPFVLSHWKP